MDAMAKDDNDGMGRNLGDGVAYLAEALDELPQRLDLALDDGVEVTLHARTVECALEIGHELVEEVLP